MDNRHKPDPRWDAVTQQLRRMRDGLDRSLAEAQKRFAAAPEQPFSSQVMQILVARAQGRGSDSERTQQHAVPADLVFTSDFHTAADELWLERMGDHLCGIVGWHPRILADGLTTDVDSTSVDTRSLRWNRLPMDVRAGTDIDSTVVDVWAESGELGTRQRRRVHEGTIRWDACLDVTGPEISAYTAACIAACMTSSDFADCSDEAIEALLRN